MSIGGFFKRLGQKIKPIGKSLYLGGKSVLHNINRIGNKIMPITDIGVGIATPYLLTNPYGQAFLAGYTGVKGGLELTNRLEKAIEAGETVAEESKKIYRDIKNKGFDKGIDDNLFNIISTANKGVGVASSFKDLGQDGVSLYRKQRESSSGNEEAVRNRNLMRQLGDNTIEEEDTLINRRRPPNMENN